MSAVDGHVPIVKSLYWPDEAAAAQCAQDFAAQCAQQGAVCDAVVTLHGTLGAGKTTWVRYALQALGVQGRIKSPTYAVVESYALADLAIWHFDFYRFNDPQEWEDAGFRDIFSSPGLKLVEWPDKAQGLLPAADVALHIEAHSDSTRSVRMIAHSARGAALVAAFTAKP